MRKGLLLVAVGIVLGLLAARYYKPVVNSARASLAATGLISPKSSLGRSDQLQKNPQLAACPNPSRERVAVLLTAGQSNAANEGGVGEPSPNDNVAILNLHGGKCFVARHPLLGATGAHQGPWIETARLLLASGRFDKIVIIATAVGGSSMKQWSSGGEFYTRLLKRIGEATVAGLTPTHFLWHHGEHDARWRKSPAAYTSGLNSLVHDVRHRAGDIPVFVSLASRCREIISSEPIRSAQLSAAKSLARTFIAIDTDDISFAGRFDGCHFTSAGLRAVAGGYAESILTETRR